MGAIVSAVSLLWKIPLALVRLIGSFVAPDFFLPQTKFAGKRVLITGGANGLGAILARKLGALGCTVVLWDVDVKGLERTEREAREAGAPDVRTYVVDLSKRESIFETAQKVQDEVGTIDILVNNAGVFQYGPFLDLEPQRFERVMTINSISHFWTLKCFLPAMMARNDGHVVTVASSAGLTASPHNQAYTASKFAAVGLHQSVYAELLCEPRYSNVHMTLVCQNNMTGTLMSSTNVQMISNHPYIFPDLTAEYVADRVMRALRRREALVLTPRFLYFVAVITSFMGFRYLLERANPIGPHGMYRLADECETRKTSSAKH